MFYNAEIENRLRFGDVVTGYLTAVSNIKEPFSHVNIEIQNPKYCVVLDPCCEIGKGTIILTPLEKLHQGLFDIPSVSDDLTNLNKEGISKNFTHPKTWNKLSDARKLENKSKKEFGQRTFFIYEGSTLFPEYTVERSSTYNEVIDPKTQLPFYQEVKEPRTFKTRHRMISFKNIQKINCQHIVKTDSMDETITSSIVLQLDEKTRELLRLKMGYYFRRPP